MPPRLPPIVAVALALALAPAGRPALAVDTNDASVPSAGETPPGFAEAAVLVEAGRYREALPLLQGAAALQPAHADTLNLLGFVSRKTGDFAAARRHYDRALAVAPNHRGALEYRGELFVETGDLAAARADLAALERICAPDCEEFRELKAVIEAAERP